MRFPLEQMQQAYLKVKTNERPTLAIATAIFTVLPVSATLAWMTLAYHEANLLIFIPTLIIPLAARFTGRLYRLPPRLFVGFIATLLQLFAFSLFPIPLWLLLMLPITFSIATWLSRVYLSELEKEALLMVSIGKLQE